MDDIHEAKITIKKAKEIITLLYDLKQLIINFPVTQKLQNQALNMIYDINLMLQEAELE